jgi:hypothetical protein
MLSRGQQILIQRASYRVRGAARSRLEERLRVSPFVAIRHLSVKQAPEEKEEKPSLKDTVRRMQEEGSTKKSSENEGFDPQIDGFLRKATETWANFSEEVGKTWGDLLKSGDRKDINKKLVHPEDTVEGEAEYTGPVDIMIIDESEHLTAWERMQRRLTEAPIISGNFSNSNLRRCVWFRKPASYIL